MGVPMVSLRGDRHAGRMSASIITAVGLAELIAENADQFVEIATKLAGDVEGLSHLRSELRVKVKASPLCDAIAFTRQLEFAYRAIWRQWCAQAAKS
jgi:predicted O-linked N-acetylglucosamine transferase (SPINDLY family)